MHSCLFLHACTLPGNLTFRILLHLHMAGDWMREVTMQLVLRALKKLLLCAEERFPAQPKLIRLPV